MEPGVTLTIAYGSRGGTAAGLATDIADDASARGIPTHICTMNELKSISARETPVVVMVMSSTGESIGTPVTTGKRNASVITAAKRIAPYRVGRPTNFNRRFFATPAQHQGSFNHPCGCSLTRCAHLQRGPRCALQATARRPKTQSLSPPCCSAWPRAASGACPTRCWGWVTAASTPSR